MQAGMLCVGLPLHSQEGRSLQEFQNKTRAFVNVPEKSALQGL